MLETQQVRSTSAKTPLSPVDPHEVILIGDDYAFGRACCII
jgi:hypothetical protein